MQEGKPLTYKGDPMKMVNEARKILSLSETVLQRHKGT